MGRHVDFDAAWAEVAGDAPTITVRGETIELPPALPARVVLLQMQAEEDPDTTVGLDELLAMIVGRPMVDRWLDDRMSVPEMNALLQAIGGAYAPDTSEAEPPGEAAAPEKGAKAKPPGRGGSSTSSRAGGRSKATSRRTTGST